MSNESLFQPGTLRDGVALIMAGGEGTRLFPLSTPEKPKQFLELYSNASLLRHTYNRVSLLFDPENIFVATNEKYESLVRQHLPELRTTQLILETHKKNTAPCIALAAHLVAKTHPHAVMGVFASDHFIVNDTGFMTSVRRAADAARTFQKMVTFGIVPESPSTDYGYIKVGAPVDESRDHLFDVERFVEKPNIDRAKEYLQAGGYLWNSGMFVWTVSTILREIAQHMPELFQPLSLITNRNDLVDQELMRGFFDAVPSGSIDHGVMEHSENTLVVEAEFEWSDLGSFQNIKMLADRGLLTPSADVEKILKSL